MNFFEDFIPVPEKFWSFETGESFKKCSVCGTSLMEPGTNYLIEKAYKKNEVIFEYAICWNCREEVMKDLSRTSLKLISNYLEEHVDAEKRIESLKETHSESADAWVSHCMIKGTPVEEAKEYQICGQFVDEHMVFSVFPYALGDKAIEDLMNLLSNETLGILNDFSDKLFDIDIPNRLLIL